jgi:hypothetical protein
VSGWALVCGVGYMPIGRSLLKCLHGDIGNGGSVVPRSANATYTELTFVLCRLDESDDSLGRQRSEQRRKAISGDGDEMGGEGELDFGVVSLVYRNRNQRRT